MSFVDRPPSVAWEVLSLPGAPAATVWTWFKPASAPDALIVRVPPETSHQCGPMLTLRLLVAAAGLESREVVAWTLLGMTYPALGGSHPLLDQPLPLPAPGLPTEVLIRMAGPPAPQVAPSTMTFPAGGAFTPPPGFAFPLAAVGGMALPPPPGVAAVGTSANFFTAIEADWQSLLLLERQLEAVRKQLTTLHARLQSLNRDLSPDERIAADNQDRRDWQDARRWLREAMANVSRHIRDFDLGTTSAAGNRNRFEQIYRDHVVPRKPIEGLAAIQGEFEQHRKTAQSLLFQMQSTQASASRDGEQRAQQLLSRIAAKVRNARAKR